MSLAGERIEHEGVVVKITTDTIFVNIESTSACSTCQAQGSCAVSEREDKLMELPNSGLPLSIGEKVNLIISSNSALKSVFWAYVMPVILLLVGLATLTSSFSEGVSALMTLLLIGIYYLILFLFRRSLERKFQIVIEKL